MKGDSENYKPLDPQGYKFILHQEGRTSKEEDNRILEYNPSKKMITYDMTTYPGQSGCPVFYGGKLIAVHAQAGG